MIFRVFDRWGGVVYIFDGEYPTYPLAFGWEGHSAGKMMPPDIYTWSCQIKFIDGFASQYQGQITLLK
jgi:hypothetical protein